MPDYEPDPLYINSRREALVLLAIFAAASIYTIVVCWIFGYGRDPSEVATYLGIPDWVMWGVFLPWTVCALVTVWFCFYFMADDPLEEEETAEGTAGASEESSRESRAGGV
jgi:fatty acid desaturase